MNNRDKIVVVGHNRAVTRICEEHHRLVALISSMLVVEDSVENPVVDFNVETQVVKIVVEPTIIKPTYEQLLNFNELKKGIIVPDDGAKPAWLYRHLGFLWKCIKAPQTKAFSVKFNPYVRTSQDERINQDSFLGCKYSVCPS
jgi:hypothetical protein